MSAPTKGRLSGIPSPSSGLPTPASRLRSTSAAGQYPALFEDDEYTRSTFSDAIRANNPAQHRAGRNSDMSLASLSVSSGLSSPNGRRSVTGRPPSVATSASAVSPASSRPPTLNSRSNAPRPPSRQSDAYARSSSRADRTFNVGDNVRIESLGFEGRLMYMGPIDGKAGAWAGVELSGGFAGKGKNNGTVNGKQYFICPPNCGVFVNATKLSAPTVGYGSRPSSVASSRNGRITPATSVSGRMTPSYSTSGRKTPSVSSGRITPSTSNGRETPAMSSGRRTPGSGIPGSMGRSIRPMTATTPAHPPITPARTAGKATAITPGSRASKYVGVTAKQLNSRVPSAGSPSRSAATPSFSNAMSSPSRSMSSPFTTPKAGAGRIPPRAGIASPTASPTRKGLTQATPRPRVPSTAVMPPPLSPSSSSKSTRTIAAHDTSTNAKNSVGPLSELEQSSRAIQARIAGVLSGHVPSSSISEQVPVPVPRPESSTSTGFGQISEYQSKIETLQARVDELESENTRLLESAESTSKERASETERLEKAITEQKQTATRVVELEAVVRTNERLLSEKETAIEGLERTVQQNALEVDKIKSDAEARNRDIQSKLDDKEALVANLKELIDAKEGLQTENDAVLQAKNAEIALLETRVQKAYAELEEERRELGSQVDELRRAGQETIALYEERLSAADTQRYELEDMIAALEEQLHAQTRPTSPSTAQTQAVSAVEIDNEALREQVQHLQKRIATLEDQLEDSQMAFEREEEVATERMRRFKEKEDSMRNELNESKLEVERAVRSEQGARRRIEEIEEALRENGVALENARAEIEVLRTEISDLEGITTGLTVSNSTEKVAEVVQRSAAERVRLQEEVAQLKQQLAQYNEEGRGDAQLTVHVLTDQLNVMQLERESLQQQLAQRETELERERRVVEELRMQVEEHAAELDDARRLSSESGAESGKSKNDLAAAKDEITGLKHIVQELQKEISAAAQRNKVLESENRLLLSETEQLREDLKMLEESVEQSIQREEQALAESEEEGRSPLPVSDDVVALQRKYEVELEQYRKRLSEAEIKNARAIHDLNKDIGELETLIEEKIYREDELEREVERLREKLSRSQRKSSKSSTEPPLSAPAGATEHLPAPPPMSASSSSSSRRKLSSTSSADTGPVSEGGAEVCEICEKPGHDIFTCTMLNEWTSVPGEEGAEELDVDVEEDLVCEDCEGRGHTADNCPHSQDVF